MTDITQRLRALPDMRPEPEPFEVWRDACGVALAGADTIDRLRAALLVWEKLWEKLGEENECLRTALRIAVTQNEHDMLMTGDECRAARAALGE